MFKKWLVALAILLSASAQAYQQGESLSPFAQQQLGLNPEVVTIIDFFAEWCVSCREELPEVNQLAQQLDASKVVVLGIDVDEDVDVANAFQQELGLTFPVVNDPEQTLVEDFQPIGMPALYYIYQSKVLKVRYGAINHISQAIRDDLKVLGLTK
ncbi:TlpA family protein disulfide reductase [Photobacterium chitinilyticum]|uniref:TlpA family protein disulfide reductase n=1 Tax=Photobacterium chitinilyticum TaxID=2485123 RepID=A0A3S3RHY2_9GAMM|nr:TlpA disulfide reductase family protein [Photobacterium chitinilyticum]RWX55786.1 TlpA family protein disulfide reductase [Photobacterium chitinilyticum]